MRARMRGCSRLGRGGRGGRVVAPPTALVAVLVVAEAVVV